MKKYQRHSREKQDRKLDFIWFLNFHFQNRSAYARNVFYSFYKRMPQQIWNTFDNLNHILHFLKTTFHQISFHKQKKTNKNKIEIQQL